MQDPEYFNKDGTIKKLQRINGKKQRRVWKNSANYIRLRNQYRDLNRRLAALRKMEHCMLANELLEHGTIFFVEDSVHTICIVNWSHTRGGCWLASHSMRVNLLVAAGTSYSCGEKPYTHLCGEE